MASATTRAPAERRPPDVAVVITARNEETRLPVLLRAIGRQTVPRDTFEVIVVDDASDDATAAVAAAVADARVLSLPTHLGLPAGRNVGIRASSAPIIALTDADCIPDDDWLERGLERFRAESPGMLAGGILMPLDRDSSIPALVDATTFLNQSVYVTAGFGAGANLWFRRDVLERVGLFNERIGMYGDERDICQRAVESGAQLLYAPEVRLVHPPRATTREVVRKAFLRGFGLSAHRRFGTGPLRHHPRLFLQWKSYVPRPWIRGRERLREQSIALGRVKAFRLCIAQYVLVQLTTLAGDVAGEMRRAFVQGVPQSAVVVPSLTPAVTRPRVSEDRSPEA